MADAAPKTQLGHDHNPSRTTPKFLSSFLYKAITATLFLVLVPLLTSRPPEFVILPGRSWEILHIVLVGITVSYGLFSRRKEAGGANPNPNTGKFENTQSYVNQFLQLSSLFDDESDGRSVSPSGSDVGRNQIHSTAWNIQYFRNEPMLVVDEDRNRGGISVRISDKPLLLPVRRLRSRGLNYPRGNSGNSCAPTTSFITNASNAGSISKRVPNGSNIRGHSGESGALPGNPGSISSYGMRSGRVYDTGYPELETNVKDSVVLPSPIPWRSRSGRMGTSEGVDLVGDTFEADDLGESCSVRPQFSRSSPTSSSRLDPVLSPITSSLPSPEMLSPSSSLSSKSSHKSRIPVPPQPPPSLMTTFKLPSEKPSSVATVNGASEKNVGKNPSSVCRDINRIHPKSVRTIRASGEAIRRNTSGKDLRENFFDGVLENEERMPEFFKKMITESEDEETQSEDDANGDAVAAEDSRIPKNREVLPIDEVVVSNSVREGKPDVDKKADEFIAKFREQIRLQRMESIKRSSAEIGKNLPD